MCMSGSWRGISYSQHVDLFKSENSAAILQIDATNAFNPFMHNVNTARFLKYVWSFYNVMHERVNSLNRNVFLDNIKVICPEISNFVINCCTLTSRLFVRGKGELKSQEGTRPGNPIAMGLYALGITPLTTAVTSPSESMHHSTKVNLHLIKQNSFLKTFLRTLILMTRVSFYLFFL